MVTSRDGTHSAFVMAHDTSDANVVSKAVVGSRLRRDTKDTDWRTNGECKSKTNKQTPWSESASELYRPSDRRLLAKRLTTFADKGCHVISVTDPFGRILIL
jgi:hypothetical protein